MGLIDTVFGGLFGSNRNVLRETVEVFRENTENAAERDAAYRAAALAQLGQEFALQRVGRFDRFMDGINRLPRPALALGTIALFVSAMTHPVWFAARMQGIALVPEPLWWLMGAIVSFYFGSRYQAKGQEFQRSIATTMSLAPHVIANMTALNALNALTVGAGAPLDGAVDRGPIESNWPGAGAPNAALDDWRLPHE